VFIFSKRRQNANNNKEIYIFYFKGPDKGLTFLLRISIMGGKSGLGSSLRKVFVGV